MTRIRTEVRAALAAALLLAAAPASLAEDITAGAITIADPWMRAVPAGAKVAGGYAMISNDGAGPDRLVGGSAAFAGRVEVHEMAMEGDVMKMRKLEDGLEIPPGGAVVLKPGSFHVMFMGLTDAPVAGESLEVTLEFETAGAVAVEFKVAPVGAMGPAGGH